MRVGVLRGGIGHEYDVSLQTGAAVLNALPAHYAPHDILVTKDGVWHHQGLPINPSQLATRVDVIFNALHGEYGEDGRVQKILDQVGIPYTGSGHYASATGMNKPLAKSLIAQADIRVPRHILVELEDDYTAKARLAFQTICPPWIIKPTLGGSSVGLVLARNFNDILQGIEQALQYSTQIMIEEFIRGQEATCGVVEDFRGATHYALLPIEIRKAPKKILYDYNAKYNDDGVVLVCPGNFDNQQKEALAQAAITVHQALGLRHYSRSDFIVTSRGVYFLEVNTLPGLTKHSNVPKALEAVGCPLPQFLDHVLKRAVAVN